MSLADTAKFDQLRTSWLCGEVTNCGEGLPRREQRIEHGHKITATEAAETYARRRMGFLDGSDDELLDGDLIYVGVQFEGLQWRLYHFRCRIVKRVQHVFASDLQLPARR